LIDKPFSLAISMIGILILFGTLGNYDRVTVSRRSSRSLPG
jgi:hypothetical protein